MKHLRQNFASYVKNTQICYQTNVIIIKIRFSINANSNTKKKIYMLILL